MPGNPHPMRTADGNRRASGRASNSASRILRGATTLEVDICRARGRTNRRRNEELRDVGGGIKGTSFATLTIRPRFSMVNHKRPPAREGGTDEVRCVRLTRKYADVIDGVDLSDAHVGDRLDLSPHDAEVLIAEGWAERDTRQRTSHVRAVAADKTRRGRKQTARKK